MYIARDKDGTLMVYENSQYDYAFYAIRDASIEMAQWKDQQFKEHNNELIDKACKMYKRELNTMNNIIRLITADPQNLIKIDESVEEFRKALES